MLSPANTLWLSLYYLQDSNNLIVSFISVGNWRFFLWCISDPGYESLWFGRTIYGEPHGHVPPADAQTHGGSTTGGTQWSGGTGAVCQSIQTKTHQTGLHSGTEEDEPHIYFHTSLCILCLPGCSMQSYLWFNTSGLLQLCLIFVVFLFPSVIITQAVRRSEGENKSKL